MTCEAGESPGRMERKKGGWEGGEVDKRKGGLGCGRECERMDKEEEREGEWIPGRERQREQNEGRRKRENCVV